MSEIACWRSECRNGCYYADLCKPTSTDNATTKEQA